MKKAKDYKKCKIYKLEDKHGTIYVGKSPRPMWKRISEHKKDKRIGRKGSSRLIDYDSCKCTILDVIPNDKEIVRTCEAYWIRVLPCVNDKQNLSDEEAHQRRLEWARRHRLELKLTYQFLKLLEDY